MIIKALFPEVALGGGTLRFPCNQMEKNISLSVLYIHKVQVVYTP